jgi:hypothetical protein
MVTREILTRDIKKKVQEILFEREMEHIYLDESFQVGTLDRSRWGSKEQIAYWSSVIFGKANTSLHWIDIKACYDYWDELGTDNESRQYFKDLLDKKYEYISLDGNNRTITLFDVDAGKLKFPKGDYALEEVANIRVAKSLNIHDKDFSKPLRDKFYNREILITFYTNISLSECGDVVRNINAGMPWNAHQMRQSRPSRLAEFIREMRKEFVESFKKSFSEKDLIVLNVDEFLTKLLSYTANDKHDFSKNSLDAMYEEPAGIINTFLTKKNPWFKTNFKSFTKAQGKYVFTSKNSLLDLWAIISDYKFKDNTKVQDMQKFVDVYYEQLTKLQADDKTYKSPCNTLVDSVFTYSGLLSKTLNKKVGVFRRNIIRNLIENKLIDDGIITQQEDPKNRFFTKEQKRLLWQRQGGICPETKKEIPIEEMFDYTKWQADHKDPFDKGGLTELDNGQLICAKFNNEKSNKTVE